MVLLSVPLVEWCSLSWGIKFQLAKIQLSKINQQKTKNVVSLNLDKSCGRLKSLWWQLILRNLVEWYLMNHMSQDSFANNNVYIWEWILINNRKYTCKCSIDVSLMIYAGDMRSCIPRCAIFSDLLYQTICFCMMTSVLKVKSKQMTILNYCNRKLVS